MAIYRCKTCGATMDTEATTGALGYGSATKVSHVISNCGQCGSAELSEETSGPTPQVITPSATSGFPIWGTVVVSLVCLSVGLSVSFLPKATAQRASTAVPCAMAAPSEQKPKAELDVVKRAAAGESQAMDELSALAVETRSVAQAVALLRGRAVQKQTALDVLRENLTQNVDGEGLKKLLLFARDGDTARSAIEIAAGLTGSSGCDLLYELSVAKGTPPEMALLAGQFLLNKEVRAKASPALTLVLDLRDATVCDQRHGLLEKAVEAGDKRILRYVVPLTKKTGCGTKKTDDCNPCLRDDNQKLIREVLAKAQGRKPPEIGASNGVR